MVSNDHRRRVLAFQDFKRALPPLTAVLEHYGLLAGMKRVGSQLFSNCPIHGGSNKKQFVVRPETNEWKCFSPRHPAGGDTLGFVMAMQNCSLQEARAHIERWFSMPSVNTVSQQKRRRSVMSSEGNRPTHKVYSAQKRGEGERDWLTHIGNGWPFEFKDKKTGASRTGMSIQLSALPLGERVVIFEADPDEEEPEEKTGKFKKK